MLGWVCVLALACSVAALDSPRDARWFFGGGLVTKVVVQKRVITEVIPSSCVQVAPSLPPCREMRELNVVPTSTQRIDATTSAVLIPDDENPRDARFWGSGWNEPSSTLAPSQFQHDEIAPQATPPGIKPPPSSERPDAWTFNDLFNGGYTTVTKTVVQEETQRFRDIDHVITFSVVGCMPTRLPFDLAPCEPEYNVPPAPQRDYPISPLDPRASPDSR